MSKTLKARKHQWRNAFLYDELPPFPGVVTFWGWSSFGRASENLLQVHSFAPVAWFTSTAACCWATYSGRQGLKRWVSDRLKSDQQTENFLILALLAIYETLSWSVTDDSLRLICFWSWLCNSRYFYFLLISSQRKGFIEVSIIQDWSFFQDDCDDLVCWRGMIESWLG